MLPETEIICTEKLKLRLITPDVYKELFEICYDDEIVQYLGISYDDLPLEKEKYKKGIETYRISFMHFQILLNNIIIGDCSFHTWFKLHNRAEIGYAMRSDEFKGKGYMSEALPKVLEYGFDKMNLNRIEALVSPTNEVSKKLLLTNKFEKEGLLNQHYLKNLQYEDSELYSLIRDKWLDNNE